jgi:predicted nucleic acid-binding protein
MIEKLIIDASVAAKWFLNDEESVDKAEQFLIRLLSEEIELHAPEILRYELGHLLTKAQRNPQRPISREDTEKAYFDFCELPITYHNLTDKDRQEVLSFANQFHRGFYDSSYIWLACRLGTKWLTSERRYGGTFPPGYPVNNVLPLEATG